MSLSRRLVLVGAVAAMAVLGACGSTFRTFYDTPVAADASRNWRVVGVDVTVPETLVVSEQKSLLPKADIVWREDPADGNRYEQVRVIMAEAARQGSAGLRGSRPVRLGITVSRFHALTFEAESRLQNAGVHNVNFVAQITDAASGQVLAGPTAIEAALPALAGSEMIAARAQGQSQKSMIIAHVRQTIAGWLGAGPDIRGNFSRSGN